MFEKGGIVGYADGGMPGIIGGASYTGDKIPIRVNSGEMILNKGQQAALYKAMHPAVSGSGISVWQQKQLFGEIKGLRGFAIGGIAGMGGFSMPAVAMPATVGEVGKDTARQVQPIAVTVKVGGKLTANGDKLETVLQLVDGRKNN
jgi:hypothetical protein